MVMVTGIICGAAVTAIITVGTEAADIIMDGTGADIADIHDLRQGRLEDEAAFFATSLVTRRAQAEFDRCRKCRCRRTAELQ